MRKINEIIVHCSDSTYGDVKEIRRWHTMRGFLDIGYHFLIRTDGEIEIGRMLEVIGAHCKGHNEHSIGIVLVGKKTFFNPQIESLRKLVKSLRLQFPDIQEVSEHNKYNRYKTCPNFDVKKALLEV